ncbi:hypothetical protein Cadr_000011208 [Camelus dromedarius]|uniref:Uncharacterized protein n=1 Tax=Camelus dromedarius TaxID=9838 RepID=A0A5N4DVB7_CAMDR|nr:hypothetical protein Cadr_000011208 [Camelus dromedarius]
MPGSPRVGLQNWQEWLRRHCPHPSHILANGGLGWWRRNDFLGGAEAFARLSTLAVLLQNQSAYCHALVLGLQFSATLTLSRG